MSSSGKKARDLNDTIRYTMWSVFSLRDVLGERADRDAEAREVEELVAKLAADDVVVRGTYDLSDAVGLSVRPVDSHVQRWGGALPQYAVGHLDRVAAVRREVGSLPGLAVCGSAYDGIGIPACIASAHAAAAKVVADLFPRTAETSQKCT